METLINSKKEDIENIESLKSNQIILKFSSISKTFSFQMPKNWTARQLKHFIRYSFPEDVKNSIVNLYIGAKQIQEGEKILSLFNKIDEIKMIIVILKKSEAVNEELVILNKKFTNITPPKEIMQTKEFDKFERYLYYHFADLIEEKTNSRKMVNHLPFMHYNFDNRIKIVSEKNSMTKMNNFEEKQIVNYPYRDYIKLELIFKLVLFFILFGVHMKGYNIPIFISLLAIYYWYNIYTDINAFYEKKLIEIKLTNDEMRTIEMILEEEDQEELFKEDLAKEAKEEEEKQKAAANNNVKVEEKEADKENISRLLNEETTVSIDNKNNKPKFSVGSEEEFYVDYSNLNKNISNNKQNDVDDIKIEEEAKEYIDLEPKKEKKQEFESINDINHLLSKYEDKKKRKNSKEKQNAIQ